VICKLGKEGRTREVDLIIFYLFGSMGELIDPHH
ncbi:uncharacterized protein METZ01_LOCUS260507, partial [marine metagenome]